MKEKIRIDLKNLNGLISKRNDIISKWEHAQEYLNNRNIKKTIY